METNFKMIKELQKVFFPKNMGICSKDEVNLIRDTLHVSEMDILQLRNLRDFTVLFFSKQECENYEEERAQMDKVSAITSVIDVEIFEKGGEV